MIGERCNYRNCREENEDILPRLHNVLVVNAFDPQICERSCVPKSSSLIIHLQLTFKSSFVNRTDTMFKYSYVSTIYIQMKNNWINRTRAGAWRMLIALRRHNDELPCHRYSADSHCSQPITSANWKCYWWRVNERKKCMWRCILVLSRTQYHECI